MSSNFLSNMVSRQLGSHEIVKPELTTRFDSASSNSSAINGTSVNDIVFDSETTHLQAELNPMSNTNIAHSNSNDVMRPITTQVTTGKSNLTSLEQESRLASFGATETSDTVVTSASDDNRLLAELHASLAAASKTNESSNKQSALLGLSAQQQQQVRNTVPNIIEQSANNQINEITNNNATPEQSSVNNNVAIETEKSPAVQALLNQIRNESHFSNQTDKSSKSKATAIGNTDTKYAHQNILKPVLNTVENSLVASSPTLRATPVTSTVNISIGSIDIRASSVPKAPVVSQKFAPGVMSLNEYLQLRKGGSK